MRAYAALMTLRRCLGLVVAAAYVGVLAWTAAGSQCPVSPDSGCARVHALMRGARPPTLQLTALPMHAGGSGSSEPFQATEVLVRLATIR